MAKLKAKVLYRFTVALS